MNSYLGTAAYKQPSEITPLRGDAVIDQILKQLRRLWPGAYLADAASLTRQLLNFLLGEPLVSIRY